MHRDTDEGSMLDVDVRGLSAKLGCVSCSNNTHQLLVWLLTVRLSQYWILPSFLFTPIFLLCLLSLLHSIHIIYDTTHFCSLISYLYMKPLSIHNHYESINICHKK